MKDDNFVKTMEFFFSVKANLEEVEPLPLSKNVI